MEHIRPRFLTLCHLYETAIQDHNKKISNFGLYKDTEGNPLEYACAYYVRYGGHCYGARFLLYDLKSQSIRFLLKPLLKNIDIQVQEDQLFILTPAGMQPWFSELKFEKIPNCYAYALGQDAVSTQLERPTNAKVRDSQ